MFCLRHQTSDLISYHGTKRAFFVWYLLVILSKYVLLSSAMNRADVKDTEIANMMDTIVDSLFSLCVTLGSSRLSKATRMHKSLLKHCLCMRHIFRTSTHHSQSTWQRSRDGRRETRQEASRKHSWHAQQFVYEWRHADWTIQVCAHTRLSVVERVLVLQSNAAYLCSAASNVRSSSYSIAT